MVLRRRIFRLVPVLAMLALASACVSSGKYETAVSERDTLQQQFSEQTALRERRDAELADAKAAAAAVEDAREAVARQLDLVIKEREKLTGDLADTQANLSATKVDMATLAKVKEDTQKSLVASLGDLDTTKRDRDGAQSALKATASELSVARADLLEARTNYEVAKARMADVQTELAKSQKFLSETQASALAYSKQVDKAKKYVDVLNAILDLDMAESEAEGFSAFVSLDAAVKATGDPSLTQPWDTYISAIQSNNDGEAGTAFGALYEALKERLATAWPQSSGGAPSTGQGGSSIIASPTPTAASVGGDHAPLAQRREVP